MAKKKEVVEVEKFEGLKTFKSNGKSKHMPLDEEFQINSEMAELFLLQEYGKLID